MSRWRPTPAEERWLEVLNGLGAALPDDAMVTRTGGWRRTGRLARIALFAMGFVAAALLVGILILGFEDPINLLVAGLIAALAAELLTVWERLYASGIEEGLSVAGFLLVGAWVTTRIGPGAEIIGASLTTLVMITAAGAAGMRRLNPLVTTCAVIVFVHWVGSTTVAHAIDATIGRGTTVVAFGCTLAAFALALGGREFRRPSHDHMFSWLVATLPFASYAQVTNWNVRSGGFIEVGAPSGRLATSLLLVALGAALLVAGLRRRQHAPLVGFMGCVACLAMELRVATSLETETWLILCGLAALVTGVAFERYLRVPRNGLTSTAMTGRDDPFDLLPTAGAELLGQRMANELARSDTGFTPGGGRFGGGGASGGY